MGFLSDALFGPRGKCVDGKFIGGQAIAWKFKFHLGDYGF
jgi:hypothetical protein